MDLTAVVIALFALVGVALIAYRAGYLRGQADLLREGPLAEAEWIEMRVTSALPRWRRVTGWVAYMCAVLLLCLFLLTAFRYAHGLGWALLMAVWALWFVIFLAVIGLAEWCWKPSRDTQTGASEEHPE
jgi:hypothetical protein